MKVSITIPNIVIAFIATLFLNPEGNIVLSSGYSDDLHAKEFAIDILKSDILNNAEEYLRMPPETVTMFISDRSTGGVHDFHSEGDYWWPDPDNPDGPYIRRDGMSNPDNFSAHRHAMIRFSHIVGTMASAYVITGDKKYVEHATVHLDAWFADPETRMNPHLNYAQAVHGRHTGRKYGIIDSIHLTEVAQSVIVMKNSSNFDEELTIKIKEWFSEFIHWLTSHEYGLGEMNTLNNHSTYWVMQVASFSRLTGNEFMMTVLRDRFKHVILTSQMFSDGSFPHEIRRTKPYSYALFNLDGMAMIATILSDDNHDLWNYETFDGRSLRKGIEFLYPYVINKDSWPYGRDVMYWDDWPVAHAFLIMGAHHLDEQVLLETWKNLEHFSDVDEVVRMTAIRNPIIWLNN